MHVLGTITNHKNNRATSETAMSHTPVGTPSCIKEQLLIFCTMVLILAYLKHPTGTMLYLVVFGFLLVAAVFEPCILSFGITTIGAICFYVEEADELKRKRMF